MNVRSSQIFINYLLGEEYSEDFFESFDPSKEFYFSGLFLDL